MNPPHQRGAAQSGCVLTVLSWGDLSVGGGRCRLQWAASPFGTGLSDHHHTRPPFQDTLWNR
jgi:hypothetical protein